MVACLADLGPQFLGFTAQASRGHGPLSAFVLAPLLTVAALQLALAVQDDAEPRTDAWSYENPDDWPQHFPSCAGRGQSPLSVKHNSLMQTGNESLHQVLRHRQKVGGKLFNDGRAMVVRHALGVLGHMTLPNGKYEVKELRFHFPAEHELEGWLADGELQIVHQLRGERDVSIVGIPLMAVDEAYMEKLDKIEASWARRELGFFKSLGFDKPMPTVQRAFNVKGVDLPAFSHVLAGPYAHYIGSLTSPPCTELVHWYIPQRTAIVTPEMIYNFFTRVGSNSRPYKPMNGRLVVFNSIALEDEFV
eukprot:CAMPEP_0117537774 /NCGR_PEP_ID=MMETSP0784-20121206/42142_1 /TAXON_ID=39447 /ORGANISM="" /LENGTH=304 /DNA_ID=CAMNT_0005334379 /DNA_START=15 /DNA_END=929 /DNA_ORIENTATION=+